ncbi:hypothetical protein HMPREF2604_07525 [Corynebacterium sp. HMSC055A01]|uniref:hypothetical protein n=1 Tax=Corynebacterium sp. HMSC055A01 TaxID=1715083 RepID=UPI0008A4656B|nr:hypothetical protein [Corynebacterium sp. HMSC055A01]OFN17782.1 hypothetical protein HMPREF2604_07525 [Corynebacterium sp. HMSC055A01]
MAIKKSPLWHSREEFRGLLAAHETLNYLRSAEHMKLEICTLHLPPHLKRRVRDAADQRGIARNGMLIEIVLSYLSSDTQYTPENRVVANKRTATQTSFRLPSPAIDHMRWLADARGITISQLTADMIVEYFNKAEAEDDAA